MFKLRVPLHKDTHLKVKRLNGLLLCKGKEKGKYALNQELMGSAQMRASRQIQEVIPIRVSYIFEFLLGPFSKLSGSISLHSWETSKYLLHAHFPAQPLPGR